MGYMDDFAVQRLAAAVMVQAIKDYESAKKVNSTKTLHELTRYFFTEDGTATLWLALAGIRVNPEEVLPLLEKKSDILENLKKEIGRA